MDLAQFDRLRQAVERWQREQAKAEGALESLLQRLKDEFGCETWEAAEQKVLLMEQQAAEAEREYQAQFEQFRAEWAGLLGSG